MGSSNRGKKKSGRERERELSRVSCHSLACPQNKGLNEHQRRANRLHTEPYPQQRGRPATARARRYGAISAPETGKLHQTVSRPSVANHVFLGSWAVNVCQEGCSLGSAPQRTHMAHLSQYSRGAPGKPSGWDRRGD